jgi:hypothetical protein
MSFSAVGRLLLLGQVMKPYGVWAPQGAANNVGPRMPLGASLNKGQPDQYEDGPKCRGHRVCLSPESTPNLLSVVASPIVDSDQIRPRPVFIYDQRGHRSVYGAAVRPEIDGEGHLRPT